MITFRVNTFAVYLQGLFGVNTFAVYLQGLFGVNTFAVYLQGLIITISFNAPLLYSNVRKRHNARLEDLQHHINVPELKSFLTFLDYGVTLATVSDL